MSFEEKTPRKIVFVKINCQVRPETLAGIREKIKKQAENGAVVLPPFCEVLAEVPYGTKVEVVTGADHAGDCEVCRDERFCQYNHGRHDIVRINCPLWRAKG